MSIFMQMTTLLCKGVDGEEFQAGVVLSITPPIALITHHTVSAVLIVFVITVEKIKRCKGHFYPIINTFGDHSSNYIGKRKKLDGN